VRLFVLPDKPEVEITMKDRVRFNVPCEAKQAMRNRQNVNVSVAFCDS
jgi:hypothetical protein